MTLHSIDDRLLTVSEVAELIGYSEWSVRKFCRQGVLRSRRRRTASRTAKGVKILIPQSEVSRFIRELEDGGQ